MKQLFIAALILLCGIHNIYAQHSFKARIKSEADKQPLTGATVLLKGTNKPSIADSTGLVIFSSLRTGKQVFVFSYAGYVEQTLEFTLPLLSDTIPEIFLSAEEGEGGEVIVVSTRTSRTIANTPTRIESINGEELDEKNNMRPANVSMLLHESTGLQVQQTSATTGNAGIRVQGLDGRYTQLLRNSYPNFGNFASGLSILEIPPLDLKQVEVIKGPASTLYGGGAIAGVVNFITKTPKEKAEYDLLLNQSNIGQTNIGGYASQKKGKFGYAILGLVNLQQSYDVDKDDFSEIPESRNFTISPTLYFYPNATTSITLGNSFTRSTSTGGDMLVIDGKADATHVYFEKNTTMRNTTVLEVEKKLKTAGTFRLKQSVSIFDRHIDIPGYSFAGINTNSFTDLSWLHTGQKHTLTGGLNLVYDKFRQENNNTLQARSLTTGLYLQDTWDISNRFKLETGIRADHASYRNVNYSKSQLFVLPRVFALFRITDKLSSRIGGGLGYKIPTIFTEQTEAMQYRNVLPLNNVKAERSVGGTADLDYKTKIGNDLSFSINQLFFYTVINNPLVLQPGNPGVYYFANAARPMTSNGWETNLKFIYKRDLKLFIGYTFTNARAEYRANNPHIPLVPKNKVNLTMMYEKEDNFKLGLEGYFTDRQYLYNGTQTPSFWEFGFMAQKTFGKVSLYVNFENFTDQRQSRYKTVVNLPHNNPSFDDIWNHTEGFVLNGGIKLRW